jgi:hypothetical protein
MDQFGTTGAATPPNWDFDHRKTIFGKEANDVQIHRHTRQEP